MWKYLALIWCLGTLKSVFSLTCYETLDRTPLSNVGNETKDCNRYNVPELENFVCYRLINFTTANGETLFITKGCRPRGVCGAILDFWKNLKDSYQSMGKEVVTDMDCNECETDLCNESNTVHLKPENIIPQSIIKKQLNDSTFNSSAFNTMSTVLTSFILLLHIMF